MAAEFMRFEDLQNFSDPVAIGTYSINRIPQISKFAQAGIYSLSPENNAIVGSAGLVFGLKHYDIIPVPSEPVNDDPTDLIEPHKLPTGSSTTVLNYNALSYAAMAVIKDMALRADPLDQVQNFDAQIWSVEVDRYCAGFLRAVADAAEAQHAGRYTLTVANEEGTAANAANQISAEAVIDAMHLDGVNYGAFTSIMMTASVFRRLQIANLIDTVEDSEANIRFNTYLGLRVVVVEDRFLNRAGTTDGTVSDVYLLRSNAVALGLAKPFDVPASEFYRDPRAGNGSVMEQYITRQKFGLSMRNVSWSPATAITTYPTYAQLTNSANWTVNADHLDVVTNEPLSLGMVRLQVNP